jgi:transposase
MWPAWSETGISPVPSLVRLAEFRRQLAYKTVWYGSRLMVAPRFYSSSKICSRYGLIKANLPLDVRYSTARRVGWPWTGT